MTSVPSLVVEGSKAPPTRGLPRVPLLGAVTLLVGGAMAPILVARIPAMADYPNHLARAYVIATLGEDKLLDRYYGVAWHVFPNLAMDAFVPPLAQLIGIYDAGKVFVLLIAVALATGPLALHHALHRRLSLWPLASVLFIYNGVFGFGLLNYLCATALALWATAVWIWQSESGPLRRGVVSWLFTVALFFSHFLGVGLYGMAIGCYELQRWYRNGTTGWRLLRSAGVLLLPFLLTLPLILASPTSDFASETHWWFWPNKVLGIYFAFVSSGHASAIALASVVATVGFWGFFSGRLHLHPAGRLFALLAVVVYLAMPPKLMSASYVDVRLPATFALFLIGMSDWQSRTAREATRFAAALVVAAAAQLTVVGLSWAQFSRQATRVEASFAHIVPGSRVLVAVNEAGAPRSTRAMFAHVVAFVMIARSAFYSDAFTDPAQQPLVVKPPYRASAPHDGVDLPVDNLAAADKGIPSTLPDAPPIDRSSPGFWQHWREDYDYLYVLFTPAGYRSPLTGVTPLDHTDLFTLYRIGRTPAG